MLYRHSLIDPTDWLYVLLIKLHVCLFSSSARKWKTYDRKVLILNMSPLCMWTARLNRLLRLPQSLYKHFIAAVKYTYRIVPNSRALPNKGAPYGLRKAKTDENEQNCPKILNNRPIFNPKPPLESSESQHSPHLIRSDLASAPCATIRDNTVCNRNLPALRVTLDIVSLTMEPSLLVSMTCFTLPGLISIGSAESGVMLPRLPISSSCLMLPKSIPKFCARL